MSLILTFLGKGGSGRTTIAIAAAKKLASLGKRVLLAVQDTGLTLDLLLETSVTHEVQQIAPNLDAVVYLVNHRSVERNIRSSIARLGVGDRVHVDTFAWTPPMQQLAHLLSGDRSPARSPTRQADTRRTAGAARHAASELSP